MESTTRYLTVGKVKNPLDGIVKLPFCDLAQRAVVPNTDLHVFLCEQEWWRRGKIENDNSSFDSGQCYRRVLYFNTRL